MPHGVFISYSHEDKVHADAVCGTLEQHDVRCWIAPRDLAPGREWSEGIIEALEKCRVMVLIFSSHANQSRQVRREVQHAFEKNVTVIPYRVENVKPEKSLDYYIGSVHWLDALTPPMERHLDLLTRTVKAVLISRQNATEAEPQDASVPANGIKNSNKTKASESATLTATGKSALPRNVLISTVSGFLVAAIGALLWMGWIRPDTNSVPNPKGGQLNLSNTQAAVENKEKAHPQPNLTLKNTSIAELELAAEKGDREAMVQLGNRWSSGQAGRVEHAEAFRWYRKAAELGNAGGMYQVGLAYEKGLSIAQDETEAAKWYLKAANLGHAKATTTLAIFHANGQGGFTKDISEAMKLYQRGAALNEHVAMNNLGVLYEKGLGGLARNDSEALYWYRRAASLSNAAAMVNVGAFYENGQGALSKDISEAVKWYRNAADLGETAGMYNMGLAYEKGKGVSPDYAQAIEWFRKAAKKGNPHAQQRLQSKAISWQEPGAP
jgi:uncharacterized protein